MKLSPDTIRKMNNLKLKAENIGIVSKLVVLTMF